MLTQPSLLHKSVNPFFVITVFSFLLLFASCKDDKTVDCDMFHWSYEGESGPDHWSSCTADCGGSSQSPVNITGATPDATLPALSLVYGDAPVNLTNTGHSIQFNYAPGSSISFNGLTYDLDQFHFHALSEHTIDGQHSPFEVHLVHTHTATGNLLVVGILLENGPENPFLEHFINDLPDNPQDSFISSTLVNVTDLLPVDQHYYTYHGSLTTPPCNEVVTWIVMKTPVSLSNAQLHSFTAIEDHNYRPIQPLLGREIRESL